MALIQPVKDGKIEKNTAIESTAKDTTGTSNLGKDAFLQLLVAQMRYQDPLNPTSDTEYISQLAQFSQLEQLQNLASTNENTQMFSMVGKEVCVSVENSDGTLSYKQGTVSGVTVSGGKAYLTVDGSLYDSEHLIEIYEDGYLLEQKMPTVHSQYFAYDGSSPKNFSFEVDFGTEEARATEIALIVDGEKIINPDYIRKNDNYFTINQDVFHQLTPGKHMISVMFNNDPYYTTKENVIEVDVINSDPKEDTDVFVRENPVESTGKNETTEEGAEDSNEAET
ncbi:MAG: flagellar hook capping FlgD N-terminal domain-containing protein [Lachnospiraceae bacterium]|nr:flagellar hook capping FlgD N-terminal domain-containing protein [Lachnospiraceae bacterium]